MACAYTISEFDKAVNEIVKIDMTCTDYLLDVGLQHWARSHFPGDHFNYISSNIAELWNSVLRDAQGFPIIPLVEYIRSTLMTWLAARRDATESEANTLTPKVQQSITEKFENSTGFGIQKINKSEYEVRNIEGAPFHVNLDKKTCSSCEFQLLSIPCSHAIAAAVRAKVRVDSLVAMEYSTTY